MADMLKYFGEQMLPAVIRRSSAGVYAADGTWTAGTKTDSPIRILTPQPANGEFLRLLPEGENASDFLQTAIAEYEHVQTGRDTIDPDEIIFDGKVFDVFEVGRWGRYGGFDKVIMRRKSN